MNEINLDVALRNFEATEANLLKLEKLLQSIETENFDSPERENNIRNFASILDALPKIDGWKPEIEIFSASDTAIMRVEAQETGEIDIIKQVEDELDKPKFLIREYRFKFDQTRRMLVRNKIRELEHFIDQCLGDLKAELKEATDFRREISNPKFEKLKDAIAQIDTLLGSSVTRPNRWGDLHRHLNFGQLHDLKDIIEVDWPTIKAGLAINLYHENEPVPVDVEDLALLAKSSPSGTVSTRIDWTNISPEDFERLIFALISNQNGYENVELLMQTNAPDKGRDVSAYRVHSDPLSGTIRRRVIIQCKHWQTKSVSLSDVTNLIGQMKLWEPPRVDVHIIATTGRFTADAVSYIEKHNQSDKALAIEMWPESHLEILLASRPAFVATFNLRGLSRI